MAESTNTARAGRAGFSDLLVPAAALGLIWGVGEVAAAAASGEGRPLLHVAAHVLLAALAVLGADLGCRVAAPLRALRPASSVAVAGFSAVAAVLFVRAHLKWLTAVPWLAGRQFGVLAVCGILAALIVGGVLALHRTGPGRALGRAAQRLSVKLAAALLLLASVPAVALLARLPGVPAEALAGAAAAAPCNVLVVTIDTLRADHLSQYGHSRATGAALEAFGFARVQDVWATSNWTKASTASLLTGTFPSHHAATRLSSALPEEARTLAEILEEQGFLTGYLTANVNASGVFGLDQGAQYSIEDPRRPPHPLAGTTVGEALRFYASDLDRAEALTHYARRFLEDVGERRFLLYLHYNDPHTPYDPPAELLERYGADYRGREIAKPRVGMEISASERERVLTRYDAEIEAAVQSLASLLEDLRRDGRLDETLVVVTADHGEEFFEHGGWEHDTTAFEEQLRVPLLVRPPGRPAERPDVPGPASLVDVVPTVLDYLDMEVPQELPGRSLRPDLEGRDASEGTVALLAEFHKTSRWAYREGDFKLVVKDLGEGADPKLWLFDLAADPAESRNLVRTKEGRRRAEELRARGAELRRRAAAQGHASTGREIDTGLEEELRRLGYVR